MSSQSSTLPLAQYLFARLKQLGVESIHGVPGDYNLTMLDHVEPSGLHWVGSANELNAGYAADGYARIKGLGAVITTYGVGELSAVNAIAGAYSERVPVVHIVGSPSRAAQEGRVLVHHTLLDGDYSHFAKMYEHVTVSQASLRDPRTAPAQIDQVLLQCLIHGRPVYIEFPLDMVDSPVSSDRLSTKVQIPDALGTPAQHKAVDKVLEKMRAAKQPLILVDGEIRPQGITNEVQELVSATQWPTWTTTFSKGLIDETAPNCHGIYSGKYDKDQVRAFVAKADLVLCFGPHFSSTNTYAYTSIPSKQHTILFKDTQIVTDSATYTDVPVAFTIKELLRKLKGATGELAKVDFQLSEQPADVRSGVDSKQKIEQSALWRYFDNFTAPGDIVLGETGTSGHGVREMKFHKHMRLFAPVTWLSIGYMLPAAQGAALAQKELLQASNFHGLSAAKTVLFIGDGSFQMTVQELSTMIRHNLDVVVFLLNNSGYTIERCIHGLNQKYNDIAPWSYLAAPALFGGGDSTYTRRVETWGELDAALQSTELRDGRGLRMVEIMLGRDDTPRGILAEMMRSQQDIEAKVEAR